MRVARALDSSHHDGVRDALAAGRIHVDQAQVIVDAVDDLPADLVDDEMRVRAEEFLLEQAGEHDAITLRRLAKRLVEVAAPEQADAAEAARLEREEAAARAAARLTMSDDGHGKTHGRFTIPTHHAAMLRAAQLHTGETISATEARRLACQAGIVPAVLDGQGRPLDGGRKRRFHTKTHRVALALRDGGCTAEGCDWPPGLCHAHHDVPWSRGGTTSVASGRLLCSRHHARDHDPAYDTKHLPDGKLTFHRRC